MIRAGGSIRKVKPLHVPAGFEVREDAFGGFAAYDFAEAVNAGAAEIGDAAKFTEEALRGFWADARNFEER